MIKNKKGFTLIELLVVIAIIALLATLAIISLTTAQRKARDTKRLADVKSVQSSVELYYSDNAKYPNSAEYTNATSTGFEDEMAEYMQLPTPPDNTAEDAYYYGTDATNANYYVGATLEDSTHASMNDSSTAGVNGYTSLSWAGDGTILTGAGATPPQSGNCGTGDFFCLGS